MNQSERHWMIVGVVMVLAWGGYLWLLSAVGASDSNQHTYARTD